LLRLLSVITIIITLSASAYAEEIQIHSPDKDNSQWFFDDTRRGFYWYEKESKQELNKSEEKKQERILPSLSDYSPDDLWNMHPDDFQSLLSDFQKKAVMKPSEQNVYEYLFIQDMARRKAHAYTNVFSYVTQKHPELSMTADYPLTAPGRNVLVRQQQDSREDKIRQSSDSFALVYFYSPTCQFCQAQSNILKYFMDKYNWDIRSIDINENSPVAARFNVQSVPRLIVIQRNNDHYMTLSVGVISMNDLEHRLYKSIRLLKGEITPQQWSLYEFQKGGVFDPSSSLKDNK
jgi:conjugal transfer pilus assembly protein TraF